MLILLFAQRVMHVLLELVQKASLLLSQLGLVLLLLLEPFFEFCLVQKVNFVFHLSEVDLLTRLLRVLDVVKDLLVDFILIIAELAGG